MKTNIIMDENIATSDDSSEKELLMYVCSGLSLSIDHLG